jgi:type I restriction enzyme, S subunit
VNRGWKTRKLAEVLSVQNGYAFASTGFSTESGRPLIRIRDLKDGLATETRFDGDYDPRYLVAHGDLLIGMDGAFGCFEWRGDPSLLNQRVCRLQDFSDDVLPRFLFHGINSYLAAIQEVTGYSTVKHLSSKQILGIEFPFPPLSEQQRIVAILDEAFKGIAIAKANAEASKARSRAVFQTERDAIFSDFSASSQLRLLGDLAALRNGISFTKDSRGESVKIVGVRDFQNHFEATLGALDTVTVDGTLSDPDQLASGDLLVVRSNGNVALVGRCMLIGEISGKTSHSGFTIRIRPTDSALLPRYLCHFMRSRATRQRLSDGGTGTNIKSLSQGALSALLVPVPHVDVQADVVDRLDSLTRQTQLLESVYRRKLAALDELKASLLHEAFSGNL